MGNKSIIFTEQNVLACCFKDNTYINKIDSKYFITNEGKEICKALRNLYYSDKPIDKRQIEIEVDKNEDVDIHERDINSIIELDIDLNQFETYYKDLKKEWGKFEINENTLKEVLRESSKRSTYDIDSIKELNTQIQSILTEIDEDDKRNIYTPLQMLDSYIETLHRRQEAGVLHSTGDDLLDSILTERFAPGTITTLFGPSGVGKSTYARHLVNLMLNKQIPTIYFSLEMSFDATMDCLCAQRLSIPIQSLYPDYRSDNVIIPINIIEKVHKEKQKIYKIDTFRLITEASFSLADLKMQIQEMRREIGVSGNIIIVLDLMTMISDFNLKGDSKANNYENAMNILHTIAKDENVHILGVVQSRRPSDRMNITSVEQLDRFRPQIEELKNSAALQERSRIILSVFRAKHFARLYLPDDPATEIMDDVMEISVLKQNMGAIRIIKYKFAPEMNKLYKFIE